MDVPQDKLTYETLVGRILVKFVLPADNAASLQIKFKDDSNELVTMVNTEDLVIALQEYSVKELYLF